MSRRKQGQKCPIKQGYERGGQMLVYVAGAYRGKSKNKLINKLQVIRNIYRAWRVARELWGLEGESC